MYLKWYYEVTVDHIEQVSRCTVFLVFNLLNVDQNASIIAQYHKNILAILF